MGILKDIEDSRLYNKYFTMDDFKCMEKEYYFSKNEILLDEEADDKYRYDCYAKYILSETYTGTTRKYCYVPHERSLVLEGPYECGILDMSIEY